MDDVDLKLSIAEPLRLIANFGTNWQERTILF